MLSNGSKVTSFSSPAARLSRTIVRPGVAPGRGGRTVALTRAREEHPACFPTREAWVSVSPPDETRGLLCRSCHERSGQVKPELTSRLARIDSRGFLGPGSGDATGYARLCVTGGFPLRTRDERPTRRVEAALLERRLRTRDRGRSLTHGLASWGASPSGVSCPPPRAAWSALHVPRRDDASRRSRPARGSTCLRIRIIGLATVTYLFEARSSTGTT